MNEGDVCKFRISTLKIMVVFNSFVHAPFLGFISPFVFMLNTFRETLAFPVSKMEKYLQRTVETLAFPVGKVGKYGVVT